MIEPQFSGIAHHAQHHRLARRAFAVGHRLPAVVVEVPQALQRTNHGNTGLVFVLMNLGPGQTRREQQQPQSSQQTAEQTAHGQEVSE